MPKTAEKKLVKEDLNLQREIPLVQRKESRRKEETSPFIAWGLADKLASAMICCTSYR